MVYKVTKTMAKLLTNAMPLSVPFPDIQNTDDCIFQGFNVTISNEEIVKEWDTKMRRKLTIKLCEDQSEKVFKDVIKEYIRCERASNLFKEKVVLQNCILKHIRIFYLHYNYGNTVCLDNITYFEYMEEILLILCKLKLEVIRYQRKNNRHKEYMQTIRKTAQEMIYVLTIYLLNNEQRIIHLLLKFKYNVDIHINKEIMNIIYEHYIAKQYLRDRSDESFCRYYLIFQRWKNTANIAQHAPMEKILYFRFNKKKEDLTNNLMLKKILSPAPDSIVDVVDILTNSHQTSVDAYFKYIEEKGCLSQCINLDSDDEFNANEPSSICASDNRVRKKTVKIEKTNRKRLEVIENSTNVISLVDDDSDVEIVAIPKTKPNSTSKENLNLIKPRQSFLDSIPDVSEPQIPSCSSVSNETNIVESFENASLSLLSTYLDYLSPENTGDSTRIDNNLSEEQSLIINNELSMIVEHLSETEEGVATKNHETEVLQINSSLVNPEIENNCADTSIIAEEDKTNDKAQKEIETTIEEAVPIIQETINEISEITETDESQLRIETLEAQKEPETQSERMSVTPETDRLIEETVESMQILDIRTTIENETSHNSEVGSNSLDAHHEKCTCPYCSLCIKDNEPNKYVEIQTENFSFTSGLITPPSSDRTSDEASPNLLDNGCSGTDLNNHNTNLYAYAPKPYIESGNYNHYESEPETVNDNLQIAEQPSVLMEAINNIDDVQNNNKEQRQNCEKYHFNINEENSQINTNTLTTKDDHFEPRRKPLIEAERKTLVEQLNILHEQATEESVDRIGQSLHIAEKGAIIDEQNINVTEKNRDISEPILNKTNSKTRVVDDNIQVNKDNLNIIQKTLVCDVDIRNINTAVEDTTHPLTLLKNSSETLENIKIRSEAVKNTASVPSTSYNSSVAVELKKSNNKTSKNNKILYTSKERINVSLTNYTEFEQAFSGPIHALNHTSEYMPIFKPMPTVQNASYDTSVNSPEQSSPISPPYEDIHAQEYRSHVLSVNSNNLIVTNPEINTTTVNNEVNREIRLPEIVPSVTRRRRKANADGTPAAPTKKHRVNFGPTEVRIIPNETEHKMPKDAYGAAESMEEYRITPEDDKLFRNQITVPVKLESFMELEKKQKELKIQAMINAAIALNEGKRFANRKEETCIVKRIDFHKMPDTVRTPIITPDPLRTSMYTSKPYSTIKEPTIPRSYVPPIRTIASGIRRSNDRITTPHEENEENSTSSDKPSTKNERIRTRNPIEAGSSAPRIQLKRPRGRPKRLQKESSNSEGVSYSNSPFRLDC